MNDLISRQAAIDALKNRWKKTRNYEGIGDDIAEECELCLKQVPSAQMLKRLINRIKHHNFCKRNRYYCPDCIYHDFVYEGTIFRGNRCRWNERRRR